MALSRSRTVAGVTFLVTVALALASSPTFTASADSFANAALTVIDGEVLISHHGQDFIAAREGDVLAAGDMIRTGDRAYAEFTYFDGSSVRLDPRTERVVERLATEQVSATALGFTQTIGRTWDVVTKLISGGSRYEVRTPSSTASVRG